MTFATSGNLPKPLDPTIQEFVAHLEGEGERLKKLMGEDMTTRRKIAEMVREKFSRSGPVMASVIDMTLAESGLKLRVYEPETITAPGCMLYLHGGGWVMFSINTHDRLMREYAHRAGCVVVGLDYSLAPE
ncbi:MAG: alpha/beta hydrolase, partial [Ponticaulis sp.]|nr:alpha/beta hydrolase [Ponticaulis sp.]